MMINGQKLNRVEVSSSFARNPARYTYSSSSRSSGGARLGSFRLDAEEFPIPVTLYKEKGETWDEIIEELTSILYTGEFERISFAHGNPSRYYRAKVIALEITEEYYHNAYGNIVIACEDQRMFGEEQTFNVTTSNTTHVITGQDKTPWEISLRFSEHTDKFELTTNSGLYLLLGYEFVEGDSLTIKYEGREVLLNGRDLRHSIRLKSNFDYLYPGDVTVRASQDCEMKYDERYF
ncbi:distal tail protein Dit [Oceanobacillus sojae]|uniref:distal tail protein Dit n=1 Tax=Oceanobacillus sojae TaxID=582851 RepID=UPI0009882EC0|nr:distal tail protein Dit [Oceanobacillus sojae]